MAWHSSRFWLKEAEEDGSGEVGAGRRARQEPLDARRPAGHGDGVGGRDGGATRGQRQLGKMPRIFF